MSATTALILAFGIGVVAGLRSLTAPAVVAWAAHLGRLDLHHSPLRFMGSAAAVAVFTLGALVEFVMDQLPKTPARTTLIPLTARILLGGLSGACVAAAAVPMFLSATAATVVGSGASPIAGALAGAAGAVAGAFGGYQARTRLVRLLRVKDPFVAIPEDVVAIALGVFIVSMR